MAVPRGLFPVMLALRLCLTGMIPAVPERLTAMKPARFGCRQASYHEDTSCSQASYNKDDNSYYDCDQSRSQTPDSPEYE